MKRIGEVLQFAEEVALPQALAEESIKETRQKPVTKKQLAESIEAQLHQAGPSSGEEMTTIQFPTKNDSPEAETNK